MNTKMIAAIAVVAVVVLGGCVWFVNNNNNESDDKLPAAFDQRDRGLVTPVKYQNPWGTCWAFGATGAAETSILTLLNTTYDKSKLDISEKHLAFFGTQYITPVTSQSQQYEGLYIFDSDNMYSAGYKHGGDSGMILTVYAQGVGPVYEKDFPYQGNTGQTALDFYTNQKEDALQKIEEEFEKENEGYTVEEYIALLKATGKMEEFIKEGIESGLFPEGTTEADVTGDFYRESVRQQYIRQYTTENEYCKYDNWSIEDFDEKGERNRGKLIGYILLDGNVLPSVSEKDAKEQWTGLSELGMYALKSELYAGHGVFGAYKDHKDYYNEKAAAYFSHASGSDHEIQIIGWDDSFSRNNFNPVDGKLPEGDGAWLCKNSWGSADVGYVIDGKTYYSDWGIKNKDGKGTGYFWISYYDRSIQDVNSLVFTDKVPTKSFGTYMYDYMPSMSGLYSESSKDAMMTANVFKADGNDTITSINVRTTVYDSTVKVSLYRLTGQTIADPMAGDKIASFEKSFDYGGYHTIILDSPIKLNKGEIFSIVCEETNPHMEDDEKYLLSLAIGPSEAAAKEMELTSYVKGVINPGESFVYKGGKWTDLSNYVSDLQKTEDYRLVEFDNCSIKAYVQHTAAAEC